MKVQRTHLQVEADILITMEHTKNNFFNNLIYGKIFYQKLRLLLNFLKRYCH